MKRGSDMNTRDAVSEIFYAALRAVDPYESVRSRAEFIVSAYQSGRYERLHLIALGKAACPMTKGLLDAAGDIVSAGVVITKYGHTKGMSFPDRAKVFEAGHPVPDMNGFTATMEAVGMASGADEKTMIVCLISGGGSSLFVAPFGPITLQEKQEMTGLLLKAGADINEMNALRKHISSVKGGRLAEIVYPGRTISLILSDVIGDRLDVIASGPTAPDSTSYEDAYNVITKYGLEGTAPMAVIDVLKKGMEGRLLETPKPTSKVFEKVENILVGNNEKATGAAREKAESQGFEAVVVSNEVQGEAREVAAELADKTFRVRGRLGAGSRPVCLISGGETTVKVTRGGKGGRNMELALAFADAVAGVDGITLLSAGTDGTDGPTDAAGAMVDGSTATAAEERGVDPIEYLQNNDSYSFFEAVDGLFITGPTGTNVMDLQIILIEPPKQ
jgi:glycerate 2-kinase